ncbi:MAG: DUF1569 domain-containing protein, partial [Planctomycetaceae bacterium]|nr:DUF1569 domain-containing protein [Planctomycetaceae bacterium]
NSPTTHRPISSCPTPGYKPTPNTAGPSPSENATNDTKKATCSPPCAFKESVRYYDTHGPLAKHPMFGKITREQNLSLNLRHAALHLGFVHPVGSV